MRRVLNWLDGLLLISLAASAHAQTPSPIRALSLDGTTADYVVVDDFSGRLKPFPTTQITVEFWMRTTDTTKDGTSVSYATLSEDNEFLIHNYRDFRFYVAGLQVPPGGAGTGVSGDDGQWHHIAVSWRNNGEFSFYRDGSLRYSSTNVAVGNALASVGTLVIGQDQDSRGGGFQASDAFLGTIDELRIWNVRRSEFDIRNNRFRSLSGAETGLVLYYRMDESSGTAMTDASGNGHTGTMFGAARVSSTAPVGLPVTASTYVVVNPGTISATLRGLIDPNGLASLGYFEWGTTPSMVNDTTASSVGPTTPVEISRSLSGLQPSTTYYYRAVGSNALGHGFGITRTFSTLGPPSVTTGPATTVTSDSAMLNATVNPRESATTVHFEYGLDTNYGSTTGTNDIGAGTTEVPVAAPIAGLLFDRTYHYRAVASNNRGTTFGVDRTFRTQVFGDIGAGLPALWYAKAAWGDYDNDGDLDLLLMGSTNSSASGGICDIWRNNGDGTFGKLNAGLPGLFLGAIAWGDYDNDNDLDLLLTGLDTAGLTLSQLRRNEGNGIFSMVDAGLPGLGRGSVAWGDYNQDGRPDLLLTGTTNGSNSGAVAQIRRNNGNGTFTDVNAGLPGVLEGSAAWADYDNDGDLDFVLTGNGAARIAQIRRNNADGTFTDINAGLPGVGPSAAAWGDYDHDGNLDLLLMGTTNGQFSGGITQLWRNNGNGTFANSGIVFPRLSAGAIAWADFDNDGNLDLVLSGEGTNSVPFTGLYRNIGSGAFTALTTTVPGVEDSALAWGDYDNDQDLDLVLTGADSGEVITRILRNDSFPPNALPSAPTGLAAVLSVSNVVFRWNAADDAQTPAPVLTYNLRIGSAPGASDLQSPEADAAAGDRRLPQIGNAQHGTNATLTLTNHPGGVYYWSVQAVDGAFAGGPFAAEQVLELVGRPAVNSISPTNLTTESATLQALINPGGRNTTASFDFGATTNYTAQLGTTAVGNGFSGVLITETVGGLQADTLYHYRASAFNVVGSTTSLDVAFQTQFLSVSPPFLALTLSPGAATNIALTLSNHIATTVSVTNRFAEPVPYAAVTPGSTSVAGQGSGVINLLLDASGLEPGLHESSLLFNAGANHAIASLPIQLTVQAAESAQIGTVKLLADGSFLLNFTGTSGFSHHVLASTNIAAPLPDWLDIGAATQTAPGQFQFTDPAASGFSQRFYRVWTP